MKYDYDVIVIGGGTSGMMAAIQAAQQGAHTMLIDKNKQFGRKLILTGGGRCNVTNNSSREELIEHIPGNGKFLYSSLDQFDQTDIMDFFNQRGISLKEEDHGRMFPVSNSARTIRDCLINELKKLNVILSLNHPVNHIEYDLSKQCVKGIHTQSGEFYSCRSVIIATGGQAYPRTGSSGDGYVWAKQAGHHLTDFYATEVPLLSNDFFIKNKSLQGISLRNVAITLWNDQGKEIVTHQMDMIFTHFGYSGPAILRCSGHVNQLLKKTKAPFARLSINLIADYSKQSVLDYAEQNRDKLLSNILKQWLPDKLIQLLLHLLDCSNKLSYKHLDHKQIEKLFQLLEHFPITTYGTLPIAKGFVTGGGVCLKEITPQTMESKKIKGLFFCGEILDINGYTGGYNITAAFSTGAVAGMHAAWNRYS